MKKLSEYQAIIVDMDGTLYYQRPVRIAMLIEMLLHFWRLPEFIIVQKYRRLYEQGLNEQIRLDCLPENAPKIIREWMIERPLRYIELWRDTMLLNLLRAAQSENVRVIVYSDYPVEEKLRALGFVPDLAISAGDTGCLKPEGSGLLRILALYGVSPEYSLVIGDRLEKDGMLATNIGAEYIVLPKIKRSEIYHSISL